MIHPKTLNPKTVNDSAGCTQVALVRCTGAEAHVEQSTAVAAWKEWKAKVY